MADRVFLSPEELPPKPDPATGQPCPPRAPVRMWNGKPSVKDERGRLTNLGQVPAPPNGEGPLLTWFNGSLREALVVIAWTMPIFVIGVSAEQGGSVEWMAYWQPWAIMPFMLLAIYSTMRPVECSAGAEWLRAGKSWVRLYELVEAKATGYEQGHKLNLTDTAGRKVTVKLTDLQRNRDLWDLVYNGILHSIVAGEARTNGNLHSMARIPRSKDRLW